MNHNKTQNKNKRSLEDAPPHEKLKKQKMSIDFEEFPDDLKEIASNKTVRIYLPQNWTRLEEKKEYVEVYVYNCLKKKRKIEDFNRRKNLYQKYGDFNIEEFPHLSAYIATCDYFRSYNIEEKKCHCQYFLSRSYCKHSLATMIDMEETEIPNLKGLEKLYQKKKVGKPKKVGKALEK